jgi:hypothetical protein
MTSSSAPTPRPAGNLYLELHGKILAGPFHTVSEARKAIPSVSVWDRSKVLIARFSAKDLNRRADIDMA